MTQRRSHQTAYDIAKAVTRAFLDDPESVVNDPYGTWKHWKEYGMTDLPLDMIYPYRDDKEEKKRKMTVR